MPRLPRTRALFVALTAATCLAAAPAAHAADAKGCDFYAAPGGNDRAVGTSAAPVASAQALAWKLQAGQTGCLKAGTYTQEIDGPYVLRVGRGGTAAAPVTIRSAPGERAKLFGIVYVPKGSDHVVIRDVAIDGRHPNALDQHTVGVQVMADDVTVADSDITNQASAVCMILGDNSGWGRATHTTVSGNTFHDCGDPAKGMLDHSVYVQGANDGQIVDNVFLRSAAFAIHFWPDAQRIRVAHNVMIDNGGGVIFASDSGHTVKDNVVEDNVIVGSKKRAALTSWWGDAKGTGNVARDNCIAGNPGGDVDQADGGFSVTGNRLGGSPMAAAASGDYRLTDSRCLALVGYDTMAKRSGTASPAAAPAEAPAPATTPAPAPAAETPAPATAPATTPAAETPAPAAPAAGSAPATTTPAAAPAAPVATTTPAATTTKVVKRTTKKVSKRVGRRAKAAKAKAAKARTAKARLAKARIAKAKAARS